MEGTSLCVVCCYSFPPPTSPPGEETDGAKVVNQFAKQVDEKGDCRAISGEDKSLSVCPECLSQMTAAVGKREAVDEMEVQVRHLQREILRLMRSLEGLVGEYLEEMRGIRDKIEGGDEACLISQRRMKEGDGVWALRSGVIRVVEQLNGRQSTSLSPGRVEEVTVKLEPLTYAEEEDDPLFQNLNEDDLLHTADFPFGGSEDTGKAEEDSVDDALSTRAAMREAFRRSALASKTCSGVKKKRKKEDDPLIRTSDVSDCPKGPQKKKNKKKKKVKPEFTTSIPPSARVFPKNHCPEWIHLPSNTNRRKLYVCSSCPEVKYSYPFHLEQHLREHDRSTTAASSAPRACPHCLLTIHHPQYWEYHVCCHEGIIRAFCDTCPGGKKVVNFFSLETHLRKEHQVDPVLQCPNCLFCCGKPDSYIHHLRKHHADGKGIQACYLCPVTFPTPTELHQHLRQSHNALQPLICGHPGCGKEFFNLDTFKCHQNFHTDKFVCTACPQNRAFKCAADLQRHTEVAHQGRRWPCRFCGQEFKSLQALNFHEEGCGDPERVAKWQCHPCEKAFMHEGSLKVHLRWHAGEVLRCTKCDATFLKKGDLTKHRKTKHPDPGKVEEQPRIPCEICGVTLRNKQYLKRHLRIHSEERKWACEICGKRFREKEFLTGHQKIHAGERGYACEICGKAYNQKAGLWQHRKSAHGSVPAKK